MFRYCAQHNKEGYLCPIMEDTEQKSRIELLAQHVLEYLDTRWDLWVLDITERGLAAASSIVTGLLLAFFGGMALLFASVGAAIWLGQRMGNPAAGYFVMAGIFLAILGGAIAFARNYIRTIVANSVLKSIQDDNKKKEENERVS